MSVSAIASLRPVNGRCLRHATTGLLSIHVKSRVASFHLRAVVDLRPQQRRYQSSSTPKNDELQKSEQPERPKITFRQFVGRALGASLRNLVTSLSPRGVRSAYRDSPVLTSMNIILLIFLLGFSAVVVRTYVQTFYNSEFSKYPEPVANTLRRAIYYTNYKPEPELALKYYKLAMEQCGEVGLDPFSDEVLGIRIQVAFWLEKISNYKSGINVLEAVLKDCKKWVEVMEQSVKDGKVDAAGHYLSDARPLVQKASDSTKSDSKSESAEEPELPSETLWRKRQRLLAKAIGTSVKLGELYADEHVLEPDNSHPHLVWAVETSLKEFQRRKTDGPRPGEEAWLTPQELGGSIESLGRGYERNSQFELAIPLFFQALRLCDSPCHRVVIMNNLSASFAQHPMYSPTAAAPSETLKELFDSTMPSTRKECLEAALNWAQNAYDHSKDVKGDDRTPECDEACAVALCNWGDVAAMMGKADLARKKYQQCIEMSTKIGFPEGVSQANSALAKLTTTPASLV